MARTDEQLAFARRLEALIRPVLSDRVRLVPDAEGFPIVPGALGRIEYLGTRPPAGGAAADTERLHVYSDRRRTIPKLLAVAGVHRGQIGDREARLWFAADDVAALAAVAQIIRPRVRRPPTLGNLAALARARVKASL